MRVLRIYHAGRDAGHRERDRALTRLGVEVTLVVPSSWPGPDTVHPEPFEIVELEVRRAGDVNRHRFADAAELSRVIARTRPDLVDLHEEPVSVATRQVLRAVPAAVPVIGYSAQNIDKRWPPPFHAWERAALRRLAGAYPCSPQAASVLRGKGFAGTIDVLPLGIDTTVFTPAAAPPDPLAPHPPTLGFVGRLVDEKGVADAVSVLAAVRARHPRARLVVVGEGPASAPMHELARGLGVAGAIDVQPWCPPDRLAALYRTMDVLLVPSRATRSWVEQFGRVVTEARACGTPVAAYSTGALPWVVGADGALVDEGDVDALTRAALRCLEHPAAPDRTSPAQCDWDEVARRHFVLCTLAMAGAAPVPTGRRAAVAEFGPPATLRGGGRPFALPLLRADTALSRGFGRTLDRLGAASRR